MKKKLDAFIVEEKRAELARQRKLSELIQTYNNRLPEIPDMNTSKLWDDLNKREDLQKARNFMEEDKIRYVGKLITSGKSNSILNIGFGSGNLEEIVLNKEKYKCKWHAVDISPQSVRRVAKAFPQGHFSLGNINELKFANESFDSVVVLEVLEHIPPSKILSALKEIRRVLKVEGTLILSVPLNEGLEQMVQKGLNPNAHVRVYTPELIISELILSGFRIEKTKLIYAFRNLYTVKTMIIRYLLPKFRQPNGIIIFARKT
jgi:ubiquinone/menaquinone biosynthesis C-methylase UbiE